MRSIREVKMLLRGLCSPRPRSEMATLIASRLAETEHAPRGRLTLPSLFPLPRPQRGRRLATALALSCLAVFAVAAPFAPPSRDSVRAAWLPSRLTPSSPPPVPAVLPEAVSLDSPPAAPRAGLLPWSDVSETSAGRPFAGPGAVSPLPDWTLAPRLGEAPPSASFTSYRTR